MSVANGGELIGGLAQGAQGAINIAQGQSSPVATVDSAISILGAAITGAQQIASWVKNAPATYYIGLAGVVTNIAAYDVARVQMAEAEARGDGPAYWSASCSAIAASAGVIAGIPLLPPHVRAAAIAINLTFTFTKEWIAGGNNIKSGFDQAYSDLHVALESTWDGLTSNLADLGNSWLNGGARRFIDPHSVNTYFHSSSRTRPPVARDPLAIDLDGDGIETVGIGANPILFDHNADGIRTGTGWVRGDDGWLVLDRNGNGLIDSGRELFGVDTLLSGTPGVDAVYAATGFAALASLDANGDGLFNAADAAFSQVRIWQDSNQDGVSQAGELSTLAARGIASIGVNASSTTINLGNGNVVSGTATVTRTNGSTTLAETVSVTTDTTAANLDLSNNPFYREFTTPVPLTSTAQALPEMGGSGWVRDLREAMSLGTPQGAALAAKVQQFADASTRDAQMALLDDVLRLWADTNQVQAVAAADDPHRRFVVGGDTVGMGRLASNDSAWRVAA